VAPPPPFRQNGSTECLNIHDAALDHLAMLVRGSRYAPSVTNGVGAGGFRDAATTAVTAFMVPVGITAVMAIDVVGAGSNRFCETSAASEMGPLFL
jgi:hypothetical protein